MSRTKIREMWFNISVKTVGGYNVEKVKKRYTKKQTRYKREIGNRRKYEIWKINKMCRNAGIPLMVAKGV